MNFACILSGFILGWTSYYFITSYFTSYNEYGPHESPVTKTNPPSLMATTVKSKEKITFGATADTINGVI